MHCRKLGTAGGLPPKHLGIGLSQQRPSHILLSALCASLRASWVRRPWPSTHPNSISISARCAAFFKGRNSYNYSPAPYGVLPANGGPLRNPSNMPSPQPGAATLTQHSTTLAPQGASDADLQTHGSGGSCFLSYSPGCANVLFLSSPVSTRLRVAARRAEAAARGGGRREDTHWNIGCCALIAL